jgi:hypothetical protein
VTLFTTPNAELSPIAFRMLSITYTWRGY